MSLKITNTNGFIIGGVLNPSITQIYIRANVDMNKQEFVYNQENEIEAVLIETTSRTTLLGGIKENTINVQGVNPIYWLNYSATVQNMNLLYLEVETDLKNRLLEINPDWLIEIVQLGVY
jgi:hypothetical protein